MECAGREELTRVARVAALAVAALAGCGDNADPVVRIDAAGAAWAAVHVGDAWTRHDELPFALPVPVGARYEVVVVCRTDVGRGWSLVGRADEPIAIDLPCAPPTPPAPATTFPVTLAVTGAVTWVTIGGVRVAPTDQVRVDLAPATYDLVALREAGRPTEATRVQVVRDQVVDRATTIAIDLDQRGADVVPADVRVGGRAATQTVATTSTAGGAWFALGFPARVLPPSLTAATDQVELDVIDDHAWAALTYAGGLPSTVDLVLPAEPTTAALRWDPLPVADIETIGDWDWVSLEVRDDGVHTWTVWVEPEVALAEGQIALTAPPVPGWDPTWLPASTASYTWDVRWQRARADGREGRRVSGWFDAPAAR